MGMGNYAQMAYMVKQSFVEKNAKLQFDVILVKLEEFDFVINDFMNWIANDWWDDLTDKQADEINLLYKELQEAFQKATGLTLYIEYHDRDDRGDDFDGGIWCVDDVVQFTPAAEKVKNEITQVSWTVFG
jgi:hypothetical protein